MLDECHMETKGQLRRNQVKQCIMRLSLTDFFIDEPDSPRNTVYVRIHWNYIHAKAKTEDN